MLKEKKALKKELKGRRAIREKILADCA